jgi:hypothetical protein
MSNQHETLNVVRGRVWLTVEGSPDDYWLAAGDSFALEPDKLVVIEAHHGDCQVALSNEQESDAAAEIVPHRAFDFFRAVPQNPFKTAELGLDVAAANAQFGYTDALCQQQKPQALPEQRACTA